MYDAQTLYWLTRVHFLMLCVVRERLVHLSFYLCNVLLWR